jgi:hypothetical protein
LAYCVWQTAKNNWQNLSLKFGVLIVGQMERQFFANFCVPRARWQLFAWKKSLVNRSLDEIKNPTAAMFKKT